VSACSKGGGYNLKNLSKDFYSVTESKQDDAIVKSGNKIIFHYSNYVYNGQTYLTDAVNTYEVYGNLKKYNNVYENILNFTFKYVEVCSNNDVKIDKDVKNSLENRMHELHSAMNDVSLCTDLFAGILKTTDNDKKISDTTCLTRYKNLLVSYEKLFEKASMFNYELSNIYFDYLLTNSNPNINDVDAANFNADVVVYALDARTSWQISNVSSVFAEMFLIKSNMAQNIVNGTNLNLNPIEFKYSDLIQNINLNVNEEKSLEFLNKDGNESYKLQCYQVAKQLYNAQTIIYNDSDKYVTACVDVDYCNFKESEATNKELVSVEIIKDYSILLTQYNEVLKTMLDILEV